SARKAEGVAADTREMAQEETVRGEEAWDLARTSEERALAATKQLETLSKDLETLSKNEGRQAQVAKDALAALARSSTQEAVHLIGEGRPSLALAHLARSLRSAPDDTAARSWISDLAPRGSIQIASSMQHADTVNAATFSPDGRRIVTASA